MFLFIFEHFKTLKKIHKTQGKEGAGAMRVFSRTEQKLPDTKKIPAWTIWRLFPQEVHSSFYNAGKERIKKIVPAGSSLPLLICGNDLPVYRFFMLFHVEKTD